MQGEKKSYDYFLTNRIGFGPAQIVPSIAMMLSQMTDGIQTIMVSLITPIIHEEWGLQGAEVSFITSLFYLGIIVGSLMAGKLADSNGRKKVLMMGSFIQVISSLLTASCERMVPFAISRFLYGIGFGFTIVVSASLFSESLPLSYRGRGMLLLNFNAAIGKVLGILLAYIFIPDKKNGNWRLMLGISSIPSMIVFILVMLRVNESVRVLLSQKNYKKAFMVINQMIRSNKPITQYLSSDEEKELMEWSNVSLVQNQTTSGFASLLTTKYIKITILMSICWFTVNFNFFGQLFILPYIMRQQKNLSSYLFAILGEIPSIIITSYLIQIQFFGRRNSSIIFSLSAGIFSIFSCFSSFSIFLTLSRLFMKCGIQMLYPYTVQLYKTSNRSVGFGVCSGFGRVGALIMPFVLFPVFHQNQRLVFGFFGGLSFLGALSGFLIGEDTLNRQLDKQQAQQQTEQNESNSIPIRQIQPINQTH